MSGVTMEQRIAYAERAKAWRAGDKTEDMLLQRLWNLADDVTALAVRLDEAEAALRAIRAEDRLGEIWMLADAVLASLSATTNEEGTR